MTFPKTSRAGKPVKEAQTYRPAKEPGKQSSSYKRRMEERTRAHAVKALENEMRSEKQSEIDRRRTIRTERQRKQAEKEHIQKMAEKMGAKKLQRKLKRMGRSKQVHA